MFLAGTVLIGAALDRWSTATAPVNAIERGRIERLLDRADEITCLAVGNSQGRAIDFGELGVEGFHVWRAGADLAENEYLLRALLPRLSSVRRVLFVLSYFSFARDNGLSVELDRTGIRRQLYSVMPGAQWVRGDVLGWVGGRMETVARRDHWWEVLQVLSGEQARVDPRSIAAIDERGFPTAAVNRRVCDPERILGNARDVRVPQHRRVDRSVLGHAPDTPERCEEALLRIVSLARDSGVELLFIMPPVSRAYTEAYDADIVRDMRERMARLEEEHGVVFHDYAEDPAFVDHAEWFMDADHLNRDGASAFSQRRLRSLLR